MARGWARIASLALAALLALAIGGVVRAHARTLGEIIDDARITAEVMTRLTAESPSNFVKIDVKSESGVVTLSGTVDSVEKRSRAAQITGAVSGVKGLVNNIQVAGAAPPPDTASSSSVGGAAIDATGTVASVDASSGTITLSDGRVLRANDRTAVYQPTTVQALKPGDRVLVRGAAPVTVRAPETRMGTVARVDAARRQVNRVRRARVRFEANGFSVRRREQDEVAKVLRRPQRQHAFAGWMLKDADEPELLLLIVGERVELGHEVILAIFVFAPNLPELDGFHRHRVPLFQSNGS